MTWVHIRTCAPTHWPNNRVMLFQKAIVLIPDLAIQARTYTCHFILITVAVECQRFIGCEPPGHGSCQIGRPVKAKHSLVVTSRPKNGIVSLEETPFNVRITNGDTSHFSTNFPSISHTLSCCRRDKLSVRRSTLRCVLNVPISLLTFPARGTSNLDIFRKRAIIVMQKSTLECIASTRNTEAGIVGGFVAVTKGRVARQRFVPGPTRTSNGMLVSPVVVVLLLVTKVCFTPW